MNRTRAFAVTEHGGIDPLAESPRLVCAHRAAYEFAARYPARKLLEAGCGNGYGAAYLAGHAGSVDAIDLFEKNVIEARGRYPMPNLSFHVMSATQLAFADGSFDMAVSFQVIEHIPEAELPVYLGELGRVLRRGGRLLISTLNVLKNRKPGQPYDKSPHHDKEFTPGELREFLSRYFAAVELWGLYPTPRHLFFERVKKSGLLRWLGPSLDPVDRFYRNMSVRDLKWRRRRDLDGCIDLMAVCHV